MKTTIIKSALFAALSGVILTGCVNGDDYTTPNVECVESSVVKTKEVNQIPASATVAEYTADDVIEAYVTSSDEAGNFYKSISLQTLDGSKGFSIPVDVTSTFTNFEPGRKMLIKLKGLYTDVKDGGMRIGGLYVSSGTAQVGRMTQSQYKASLIAGCTKVNEDDLVRTLTVNEAKQDQNLNTLIELDGVQFTDAAMGKNYYDPANDLGGATNHYLTNNVGHTVIFRTSSFANFAYNPVPSGYGKVRGVMTKFGTDYQFMARTEDDVMLTGDRAEIDFAPPVVGATSATFNCALTENFETYTAGTNLTGQNDFPAFINDAAIGTAYWRCRSNGTPANKYIQMTAFSTGQAVKTYFIVPVDFACANGFSFQSRASFNVGNVLKVYYSTDYVRGGKVSDATLTDITSSFTISTGNSATGTFTNSGVWSIPAALTTNGYILFEYTGSAIATPALTTNMDLDNIVIN